MSILLDLLMGAGAVLDTPGAILRNSLAGQNPLQGLFNPEERTTGRGLLEQWGILGENQEGFDAGDVAGFGAEVIADPLNILGLGLIGKAAKGASATRASNATSEALRASGAIPEEVLALSKVQDPVFHGTTTRNLLPWELEPSLVGKNTKDGGWFGAGVYWSPDEKFAESFSRPMGKIGGPLREKLSAQSLRGLFDLDPDFPIEILQHQAPFFGAEAKDAAFRAADKAKRQGFKSTFDVPADSELGRELHEALDFNAKVGDAVGRPGSRMGGSIGVPPGKMIGAHLDIRNPAYVGYADPYYRDEFGHLIPGPEGYLEVPRELSKFYEKFSTELKPNTVSQDVTDALKELGYDSVIAQGEFPEIATFFSNQAYLPFVAPAIQEVPRIPKSLLAALLGYNTLQSGGF